MSQARSEIEAIEYDGKRYAEVIRADARVGKTTFYSPAESSFQFGLLAHEAGFIEPPHYHRPFDRTISDLQQMSDAQHAAAVSHPGHDVVELAEYRLGEYEVVEAGLG